MVLLYPTQGFVSLVIATTVALLLLGFGSWRRRRLLAAWLPGADGTSAQTDVSGRKRAGRSALLVLALAFVSLALSRPVWVTLAPRAVVAGDVILLVDCSRSMRAADVAPDRFTVAVRLAEALVRTAPARRFGLVAFAGEAFGECPLTHDRESVLRYLERLSCDSIPLPGTDLNQALAECGRMLGTEREAPAALVLFSDGEQTAAAKQAAEAPAGTGLLAVGVGNPGLASPIPTSQGPLLDAQSGQPVASRPDFSALQALGDGFLVADEKAAGLASQWLRDRFAGQTVRSAGEVGRVEWYPWLALAALLCLCARWALDERNVRPALALLVLFVALPAAASPEETYGEGLLFLQTQSFPDAVIVWRRLLLEPGQSATFQAAVRLNLGAAQHQLGRQLALVPSARARALAAFSEAETCYRACLWDQDQAARAARNLARLAQDQERLSPLPEPPASPPVTQPEPPPDSSTQAQAAAGGAGSGEGGSEGQASGQVEAEKTLSSAETAAAVQALRDQEGDFNDALRQQAARTWHTLPPAKPW